MQVQPVNNRCNPNFGMVYASCRELSKHQERLTKFLVREFRDNKFFLSNDTLEKHFQDKGYDFIIRPYGKELVTVDAYKGLQIEQNATGKLATFNNNDKTHIGNYDEYDIAYLADDIMNSFHFGLNRKI